ncbi:unnamed protein product [Caenorhabditis brenneri]
MNHYHSVLKFIFLQGIIMTIYHFNYIVMDLADDDADDYENEKLTIWGALKEGLVMLYHYFNQYFLYLFTRVQCLLISIVTLQRFLLCFIPATEPYVNLEQKTMSVVIKCIYLGTGIVALCYSALDHFELVPTFEKDKTWKSLSPFGFHYPLSFYMFYRLHYAIDSILEFSVEIDFLNTPLIVQTSYLFCNKRNVETLFSKDLLKMIFCIGFRARERARVMPLEEIYSTNGVIG